MGELKGPGVYSIKVQGAGKLAEEVRSSFLLTFERSLERTLFNPGRKKTEGKEEKGRRWGSLPVSLSAGESLDQRAVGFLDQRGRGTLG